MARFRRKLAIGFLVRGGKKLEKSGGARLDLNSTQELVGVSGPNSNRAAVRSGPALAAHPECLCSRPQLSWDVFEDFKTMSSLAWDPGKLPRPFFD